MHEALRHHTLLQLKAGGPPPAPGLSLGSNPAKDANTKFRGDSGRGVTLRNLLVGNRSSCTQESRRLPNDDIDDTQACSVAVVKDSSVSASHMSSVHRLMTELLGAATEFRRLHSGSEDCDDDDKDDEVLSLVAAAVSQFYVLSYYEDSHCHRRPKGRDNDGAFAQWRTQYLVMGEAKSEPDWSGELPSLTRWAAMNFDLVH